MSTALEPLGEGYDIDIPARPRRSCCFNSVRFVTAGATAGALPRCPARVKVSSMSCAPG